MVDAATVAEIMGGEQTLRVRVRSSGDLESAVRRGLPKAALRRIVERATRNPATRRSLMTSIVPPATYKRRRTAFTATESERMERLARVVALAVDAFGDEDDARLFLETPHPLLEDRTPLDAARSELGARRVEEVLGRMQYGIAV